VTLTIKALDHLVLNVDDVEASARWYQQVLGMRREDFIPGPGKALRVSLRFGDQKINLRPVTSSHEDWFTAMHATVGSDDLCFLCEASPVEVLAHLHGLGIAIELGPVKKRGAIGLLNSVYCRDPSGNLIEIASYGDAA